MIRRLWTYRFEKLIHMPLQAIIAGLLTLCPFLGVVLEALPVRHVAIVELWVGEAFEGLDWLGWAALGFSPCQGRCRLW